MELENVNLELIEGLEERSFWVGLIFINHRVRVKIFRDESFANLVLRLTFILGIEEEYLIGMKPYSMEEEEKKSEEKKSASKKKKVKKSKQEESEEKSENDDEDG
mmetsp:Transcript_39026/g.37340  ORF Transcript_39026/g.37340 Transcript_39026/m.37340 type:complete len:105 (+) Transcript_39026:55-369(+)